MMQTTTGNNGGLEDTEMMEQSERDAVAVILSTKTSDQRVHYFRREFHKTKQPIQDLSRPQLCEVYPEFSNEICKAYLRFNTFTAKVWVNYDSACKQFFLDKRALDCGKLVFNRSDTKRIALMRSANIEVNRVILDVGTAFKTLGRIVLRVSLDTGEVRAMWKPETSKHTLLNKFLIDVCADLSSQTLTSEHTGFTLDHLDAVADELLREKDNKIHTNYHSRLGVEDEWMNSGRGFPSNPGYVRGLGGYR